MLLRLANLGVTNPFAVLRLLAKSNRDKDPEILALRHQIAVLERQLGGQRVRFEASDRALLAALLQHLPMQALRRTRLQVRRTPFFARNSGATRTPQPLDSMAEAGCIRTAPEKGKETAMTVEEVLVELDEFTEFVGSMIEGWNH